MIVDGNEAAFVMRVLRSGDEGGGGATLRGAGGEVEFQKLQMVFADRTEGKNCCRNTRHTSPEFPHILFALP
jgi:hypothetical protein